MAIRVTRPGRLTDLVYKSAVDYEERLDGELLIVDEDGNVIDYFNSDEWLTANFEGD